MGQGGDRLHGQPGPHHPRSGGAPLVLGASAPPVGQSGVTERLERLEKVERAAAILRAHLAAGAPRKTLDEGAYRAYGWLCEALDEAKEA